MLVNTNSHFLAILVMIEDLDWKFGSIMTIKIYVPSTKCMWYSESNYESCSCHSFTKLKEEWISSFFNVLCWENSYLRRPRNSCLLMDHSRRINRAVWSGEIFHSRATCFFNIFVFCCGLWNVCVRVNTRQSPFLSLHEKQHFKSY